PPRPTERAAATLTRGTLHRPVRTAIEPGRELRRLPRPQAAPLPIDRVAGKDIGDRTLAVSRVLARNAGGSSSRRRQALHSRRKDSESIPLGHGHDAHQQRAPPRDRSRSPACRHSPMNAARTYEHSGTSDNGTLASTRPRRVCRPTPCLTSPIAPVEPVPPTLAGQAP